MFFFISPCLYFRIPSLIFFSLSFFLISLFSLPLVLSYENINKSHRHYHLFISDNNCDLSCVVRLTYSALLEE